MNSPTYNHTYHMTHAERIRERKRKWRTEPPAGKRCECGQLVSVFACNAWMCERCYRCQTRLESERRRMSQLGSERL